MTAAVLDGVHGTSQLSQSDLDPNYMKACVTPRTHAEVTWAASEQFLYCTAHIVGGDGLCQ